MNQLPDLATTTLNEVTSDDCVSDSGTSSDGVFESSTFQSVEMRCSKSSKSTRKKNTFKDSFQYKNSKSHEFRREFSKDHPLAGGKGKYPHERAQGQVPLGFHDLNHAAKSSPQRVSVVKKELVVEPVRQFLKYKDDVEKLFLIALEEEELAEQERMYALSLHYADSQERDSIMKVIQEDRARASSRLRDIAEHNEKTLKTALNYLLLEDDHLS